MLHLVARAHRAKDNFTPIYSTFQIAPLVQVNSNHKACTRCLTIWGHTPDVNVMIRLLGSII